MKIITTLLTFLDLQIKIDNGIFNTAVFDKRDDFGFNITRLPYRCSNIPHKMFYASAAAECLRICRATSNEEQAVLSIRSLLSRIYKQGAVKSQLRNSVAKTFNKNLIAVKFKVTTDSLLNKLFL